MKTKDLIEWLKVIGDQTARDELFAMAVEARLRAADELASMVRNYEEWEHMQADVVQAVEAYEKAGTT